MLETLEMGAKRRPVPLKYQAHRHAQIDKHSNEHSNKYLQVKRYAFLLSGKSASQVESKRGSEWLTTQIEVMSAFHDTMMQRR
jgi:hypothetical protein